MHMHNVYPNTAFTLLLLWAEGKLELSAPERTALISQVDAQLQRFLSLNRVKGLAETHEN